MRVCDSFMHDGLQVRLHCYRSSEVESVIERLLLILLLCLLLLGHRAESVRLVHLRGRAAEGIERVLAHRSWLVRVHPHSHAAHSAHSALHSVHALIAAHWHVSEGVRGEAACRWRLLNGAESIRLGLLSSSHELGERIVTWQLLLSLELVRLRCLLHLLLAGAILVVEALEHGKFTCLRQVSIGRRQRLITLCEDVSQRVSSWLAGVATSLRRVCRENFKQTVNVAARLILRGGRRGRLVCISRTRSEIEEVVHS